MGGGEPRVLLAGALGIGQPAPDVRSSIVHPHPGQWLGSRAAGDTTTAGYDEASCVSRSAGAVWLRLQYQGAVASNQGLTPVQVSAQSEHFLWDKLGSCSDEPPQNGSG